MKIGLVFPVLNNFKGFTEAVWSVKSRHDIQIYVRPQWIDPRPSLAAAWNAGAKEAFADGCEYAIICNDDIMFSPDTIDAMVEQYVELRHKDNVIMVTPNNINLQLTTPYDILTYERPDDPFTYSEHPNFSCILIAPEFFELHGTFDENFYPAFWEDNDSHYRARLLGYKEICTTAAPMVHIGGVSTSIANVSGQPSQEYYFRKWGSVKRDLDEAFKTPYNDPTLTPKDWR
jgi:hypothetical protein